MERLTPDNLVVRIPLWLLVQQDPGSRILEILESLGIPSASAHFSLVSFCGGREDKDRAQKGKLVNLGA